MVKLWDKGYELEEGIEEFTVGGDYLLDDSLVKWDVAGSIAHAHMLKDIGILSPKEFTELKKELLVILKDHNAGKFKISRNDEDVHTAIENRLVKRLGRTGKRIHTCRSRNDQVLLDLRLYSKEEIFEVAEAVFQLIDTLLGFAKKGEKIPVPGRTHTQRAMPSSVGLWAGAYAESLLDDVRVLKTAFKLIDQSPLGSAASYGVPLPINRQEVSDMLGFAKVQNNVLYANNSRGKIESIVISALGQIMADLSKMSGDLIFFSIPEIGYISIPDEFCTGSSIMPNKKNPDILELVRAKSEKVLSAYNQVINIIKDLPSGYNRDFQETKEPLMESFGITLSSVRIMTLVIEGLEINEKRCKDACVPEIFATDAAIELAAKGKPWREAYIEVAKNLNSLKEEDPVKNIMKKTHQGATGNLGLALAKKNLEHSKKKVFAARKEFETAIEKILG